MTAEPAGSDVDELPFDKTPRADDRRLMRPTAEQEKFWERVARHSVVNVSTLTGPGSADRVARADSRVRGEACCRERVAVVHAFLGDGQELALAIANRVFVLQRGRIALSGTTDEVRTRLSEVESAYLSSTF